jgi:lipoprotein NlpD
MWGFAALMTALVLSGCANKGRPAPVEDRSASEARSAVKLLPGAENAGKPGYYTVKPGDTLIRIGMDNGQSWRDIVRWNRLENPNLIETGQVLRVQPPVQDTPVVARPIAPLTTAPAPANAASAPRLQWRFSFAPAPFPL